MPDNSCLQSERAASDVLSAVGMTISDVLSAVGMSISDVLSAVGMSISDVLRAVKRGFSDVLSHFFLFFLASFIIILYFCRKILQLWNVRNYSR